MTETTLSDPPPTATPRGAVKPPTSPGTAERPAAPRLSPGLAPAHHPAARPAPAGKAGDAPRAARSRGGLRDLSLYALIGALVLGAWAITRQGLYTTKSDIAYWLGVAGGVGMLLLLSYPMRKHLRFMHRMGPAKIWFVGHMLLGVGGPLLILLHSNFQIGSLNAGVAFYSMVTVALSGVIGRFLYLRLHTNLSGEKLLLGQLRKKLHADGSAAAHLRVAPVVVAHCQGFEAWALERRMVTGAEVLRTMLVMPWVRWRTAYACRAELRRRLGSMARAEGWSRHKLRVRQRAARRLTARYLLGAQRVAMFSAWERLFSWWHVAHVPFVYILALSAVVHVVAVHAY